MKLLNNRIFACGICLAAAVFSIFVLGGRKLSVKRESAENAFFEGQNGYSAHQDLLECREYAANLIRIAEQAVPESAALKQAEKAFEEFGQAETPEDYFKADEMLQDAIDLLYDTLAESEAVDEEMFRRADKQYVNFNSKQSNLIMDGFYNGRAEEYNELCGKFPASLIGSLTGNGPLPVFARERE